MMVGGSQEGCEVRWFTIHTKYNTIVDVSESLSVHRDLMIRDNDRRNRNFQRRKKAPQISNEVWSLVHM